MAAAVVKREKDLPRKWTDDEVEVLIDHYEAKPCLWDISCKDYHLRDVKNIALKVFYLLTTLCILTHKPTEPCWSTDA